MSVPLIAKDITDAFTQAGFETVPEFGKRVDPPELDDPDLLAGGVMRRLQVLDIDPEGSPWMLPTNGLITAGRLFMTLIGTDDKQTVTDFNTWLTLVYNTSSSAPGVGPITTLGSLCIYLWRPIGTLVQQAEQFGNVWIIDQLCEFAVTVVTP